MVDDITNTKKVPKDDFIKNQSSERLLNSDIHGVRKDSVNITEEELSELKQLLPHVFSEGKVDWNMLKRTLGEKIADKDNKYSFNWAGRKESFKNIQTTAKGTLIPDKDESINFKSTKNIFIEGDNLEVLKLLQKAYFNKIKMIYIDPPYNTGRDFVYKDNFRDSIKSYLEQTDQVSKEGFKQTTNPETSGRFHSDWISMMYPRLFLARNLLKDDGVIFVSIDDNEVHNLRMLMNEIFGEENFVANIIWQKKYSPQNDATYFSNMHDHILCYAKIKKQSSKDVIGWNMNLLPRTEEQNARYTNRDDDPRGPWKSSDMLVRTFSADYDYEIITPSGRKVNPPKGRCWRFSREKYDEMVKDNRIFFGNDGNSVPSIKRFLSEVKQGIVPSTIWFRDDVGDNQEAAKQIRDIFDNNIFDTPKPTRLIKRMIELSCNQGDIILDFFSGSGSTGQAVFESNLEYKKNLEFILVQLPEPSEENSKTYKAGYKTISDICRSRLQIVIKKLVNQNNNITGNIDTGFKVFKLAKSNFKIWEDYKGKDPKELKKQITFFTSPLVENYKRNDVIYECIIKEGYSLNSKIKEIDIEPNIVSKVTDEENSFYICLDPVINDGTIDKLELNKDDIFMCIDDALDDTKKSNLAVQCTLKTI